MRPSSHKTLIWTIVMAVGALSAGGCGPSKTGGEGLSNTGGTDRTGVRSTSGNRSSGGEEAFDFGDDFVDAQLGSRSPLTPATSGSSARPAEDPRHWTIILKTFSAENHVQAAATMVQNARSLDPVFGQARVETTEKGSVVVLGRYHSPDDAQAKADLERVRGVTVSGRPVLPRAYLSRLSTGAATGALHPNDLRSARRRHPNVRPLYTLDVAVWFDFGDRSMSLETIQRRAEAYASELRSGGHDAYFLHDDDLRMSVVTVGLFDRTAYDHEAGLLDPAVQMLMRRFPERLNNGEPLYMPVDPRRPEGRQVAQTPMLVEVP